ncbi:MAG: CatB-related O-acetyltransferase [Eubacterium sp.]|nr:CatB-related O-acetyltransferase [Eubacterium sp.]
MLRKIAKHFYWILYNRRNHTFIKSYNASIRAVYGKGVLIDRDTIVEEDVSIGDYSYINKRSSAENCTIGKYCSISSGVYINPFEHNLSRITTHPFAGTNDKKNEIVKIGNDVWIGLNCIILQGVSIGDGAVIAAGSVVTSDVKPYEIVGGIPAKHIGNRADKDAADYLERLQWWNWSVEQINENMDFFKKNLSDLKNDYIENKNTTEANM